MSKHPKDVRYVITSARYGEQQKGLIGVKDKPPYKSFGGLWQNMKFLPEDNRGHPMFQNRDYPYVNSYQLDTFEEVSPTESFKDESYDEAFV